jgi:hypothetical protein
MADTDEKSPAPPLVPLPPVPPTPLPLSFVETIPFDELTLVRLVGRGGFKQVHEGQWRGHVVAVLQMPQAQAAYEPELLAIMSHHPELLRFYGRACLGADAYLVTEFAARGDLHSLVLDHDERRVPKAALVGV